MVEGGLGALMIMEVVRARELRPSPSMPMVGARGGGEGASTRLELGWKIMKGRK
jgi:hypothetical protein